MELNKCGFLSWVLIPMGFILYQYTPCKPLLYYSMLVVAFYGILETLIRYNQGICDLCPYGDVKYIHIIALISLVVHGALLYILKDFKQYGYPNYGSYIIGLFGISIVTLMPWWPYKTSREFASLFAIGIYSFSSFFYKIKY